MSARFLTIDDLHRSFDGRVPRDLLRLATEAPRKVQRAAQVRLIVNWHDKQMRTAMAEAIVEIHEDRGGEVTERDLLLRGFTEKDIRAHRNEAMKLARPRLRGGADAA